MNLVGTNFICTIHALDLKVWHLYNLDNPTPLHSWWVYFRVQSHSLLIHFIFTVLISSWWEWNCWTGDQHEISPCLQQRSGAYDQESLGLMLSLSSLQDLLDPSLSSLTLWTSLSSLALWTPCLHHCLKGLSRRKHSPLSLPAFPHLPELRQARSLAEPELYQTAAPTYYLHIAPAGPLHKHENTHYQTIKLNLCMVLLLMLNACLPHRLDAL